MENRFQKIRELGSKGKKSNPLLLEEFQWENEWVSENDPVHEGDDITWNIVDEAIGATEGLQGRHFPRAAAAHASATDASARQTYARTRKRPRRPAAPDIAEDDDSGEQDQEIQTEAAGAMEEDEDSGSGHIEAEGTAVDGFHLNDDLLN